MTVIENDCCDCAAPAYPCLGSSCPNRHVPHYYCDKCKQEFDPSELYVADKELCAECLLKQFKKVGD